MAYFELMLHFCTGRVENPLSRTFRSSLCLSLTFSLSLPLSTSNTPNLFLISIYFPNTRQYTELDTPLSALCRNINICANPFMATINKKNGQHAINLRDAAFYSTSSFRNQFAEHYCYKMRVPDHPWFVIDEQFFLSPTSLFAVACQVKWCVLVSQ